METLVLLGKMTLQAAELVELSVANFGAVLEDEAIILPDALEVEAIALLEFFRTAVKMGHIYNFYGLSFVL